jgi:hypothetical protein
MAARDTILTGRPTTTLADMHSEPATNHPRLGQLLLILELLQHALRDLRGLAGRQAHMRDGGRADEVSEIGPILAKPRQAHAAQRFSGPR